MPAMGHGPKESMTRLPGVSIDILHGLAKLRLARDLRSKQTPESWFAVKATQFFSQNLGGS
jgi:hypothetical protein